MKEIKFVDVGEGITEGHLQKWLVKDGDIVKEDQPLFQIETDKAVVNIPSPISGMVKIIVGEDATVHVGDTIATIGTEQELKGVAAAPSTPKAQAVQQSQAKSAKAATETAKPKEIIATPAVRKLARDMGVDLKAIVGTGPEGRIVENDIRNIAHETSIQTRPVPKYSEVLEKQHSDNVERVPMSYTRKAIAKNMEASWTIPRAVHMDIIDATALFEIVQREKPKVLKEFGTKLTFLPYIIKAVVAALKEKENERFNASFDHEKFEIILKRYYNIGLAAEAPDGLKVISIKDADRKSILELAKETHELGDKVRNGTISLEEMRDSTFTITNIGSLGGGYLSVPMINYPEVAILGIHLVRDAAMVKDGKVVVGKQLPFSLSFDHRVVDGAEAVHFGNSLIKYLEDPDFLEIV
ncbi:MAG: 2-oxo acid dehydrogenase subunit E2 [Candidatus Micrarchaeota archaeon]|nr:2-oxo acid dehydrogenase subunit E2 [Candidatus Micrarchaeota archaeon]